MESNNVKIIKDIKELREHVSFILNKRLDANIQPNDVWLELTNKASHGLYNIFKYSTGIKCGGRSHIKPIKIIVDPSSITIIYGKINIKDGYEFIEITKIISWVNNAEFLANEIVTTKKRGK